MSDVQTEELYAELSTPVVDTRHQAAIGGTAPSGQGDAGSPHVEPPQPSVEEMAAFADAV
ncbi:hypothetical protein V7S43_014293 [Phytophthora oleae]|uniref:Uncharacterized protein n=1 Tax=Phytophthora oleae TaxID=2107226 RepID=A0ABD3F215_9STRA